MSDQFSVDILGLTAQIVSAHLSNNRLETEALPSLIQSVYRSLATAEEVQPPAAPALSPAVPVKKSVFPDYIVCLENGKKLKMLKRYLQASYGMTPEAYRTKWGLPSDYPMVAPSWPELTEQPPGTHKGCRKSFHLGFPHTPPIRHRFRLRYTGFLRSVGRRSRVRGKHMISVIRPVRLR